MNFFISSTISTNNGEMGELMEKKIDKILRFIGLDRRQHCQTEYQILGNCGLWS
jgi:hypothetical protein